MTEFTRQTETDRRETGRRTEVTPLGNKTRERFAASPRSVPSAARETMESYLERREESFQNSLVKCRYQPSLTRSQYFWTKRTTSSDVMSVVSDGCPPGPLPPLSGTRQPGMLHAYASHPLDSWMLAECLGACPADHDGPRFSRQLVDRAIAAVDGFNCHAIKYAQVLVAVGAVDKLPP